VTDQSAWYLLRWFFADAVLPALFLVLATLGLWWRSRAPLWLAIVACSSLLAIVASHFVRGHWTGISVTLFLWLVIPFVLLAFAARAITRVSPWRGALLVSGLLIPAPLLALSIAWFIEDFPNL
jgi:hypothetical protein